MKKPAESSGGRHSQKSETRISAIADFAPEYKREKKALLLSPDEAASLPWLPLPAPGSALRAVRGRLSSRRRGRER